MIRLELLKAPSGRCGRDWLAGLGDTVRYVVRREAGGLNWAVGSAVREELPDFLYLGERSKRIWKLVMAAGRDGSVKYGAPGFWLGQMGGR